ncbi:MAG TPA: hypothetical protein VGS07_04045 [Thermoanaerobaculia bacterium]|nr:hypothetical protein [Thermoanaerobaculia bacterium]
MRLRYSATRPEMFHGNAFEDEDSPAFTDDDRWPVVAWSKEKTIALRTNPFGDLYVLLRVPILKIRVKAPLAWLAAQKDETYVPPDLLELAREYREELQRTGAERMALKQRTATIDAELERLQSEVRIEIGGLGVPLSWALPGAGGLVLAFGLLMAYHTWRIRRLFSYRVLLPADLLFLSSPLLRRGPAAKAMRACFVLPSLVLGAAFYRSTHIIPPKSLLDMVWLSIPIASIVVTFVSLHLLRPLVVSVSESEFVALCAPAPEPDMLCKK